MSNYWGQDDPDLRDKLKYKMVLKNRIKSWLPVEGRYEYLSSWDYRKVRYIKIYNYGKIGFSPSISTQELEWIIDNRDRFMENLRRNEM